MALTLRPRQIKAIEDITAAYRAGYKAPILVMPTGGGKTHTAVEIVRKAVAKGRRVWFMAHLREILDATAKRLIAERMHHGFIMAGRLADRRQQVQIVSVQTAVRRLDRLERPDLIIIDEAHLAVAATYQDVIKWAGPTCWRLLLTASPIRLDGRGMGEIADIIIPTCGSAELIAEGLLAPIKYYAPSTPDLSEVQTVAGEYNQGQLAAAMDRPRITGSAVEHYIKLARNRPAVAFCVSVEHANHVAEQFRLAGFRAVAISGDTDPVIREAALADVQAGRLDVVCNCQLWVAGVDAPAVSCIIQLAPTQSLVKYLQSIGRGLRAYPGKDCCVVLDHAGNSGRHGSPLDEREWSLSARPGKKAAKKTEVPVKQCPSCFATVAAAATDCACGHHFKPEPRQVEEVEGELQEVDMMAAKRVARMEQGQSKDRDALIALGRKRGIARAEAWADHVLRGRAAKELRMRELAGLNA